MATDFPRIAIIGSGAVGTYFGARIALGGGDVRFLMRADLGAVRARGSLVILGDPGRAELRPVSAFGSPAEMGPADLVVIALKTTSSGEVRSLVEPVLGPQSSLLTLQNGLGADEFLAGVFGAGRVVGGLVFMAITRTGPGEVTCFHPGLVSIGEFQGPPGDRIRALEGLLEASGIRVKVVANLLEARWRKLVWNVPFNGLSIAEGGIATDRICADAGLAGEARALMLEVQRAAAAFGFAIPDAFIEKQFEITPRMGPYQPSSLIDYLAGREVEVESIWGEPLRRARAAGVEMPRLGALYGRLVERCRRPV